MKLSSIVAVDRQQRIGDGYGLFWRSSEDFGRFKQMTMDKILIMGRTTAEECIARLEGRTVLVVSRGHWRPKPRNLAFFGSIEEAIRAAHRLCADEDAEVFIAGGGEIYEQTQHLWDRIYETLIPDSLFNREIVGESVYFPKIGYEEFPVVSREESGITPGLKFYVRERKRG